MKLMAARAGTTDRKVVRPDISRRERERGSWFEYQLRFHTSDRVLYALILFALFDTLSDQNRTVSTVPKYWGVQIMSYKPVPSAKLDCG